MKQVIANQMIRAREVRLALENGESGVITLKEALQKASDKGLDLIQITDASVPVVKIHDLNKFNYEQQQNEKRAKKAQRAAQIQVKEIQLKVGIQKHDLDTKLNQAKTFLSEGKHVRIVLRIQGRRGKPDAQVLAQNLPVMTSIVESLPDIEMQQKIQLAGNNLNCVIKSKGR